MQKYEDIARAEGAQQNMITIVKKGILSVFDAAKESGLTVEEFTKLINETTTI